MPGNHPEDSVGDCITSVLNENPELDEESAARICNATLKADLTEEQKTELIQVERAVQKADITDHATALGQHIEKKLQDDTGQKAVAAGKQAPLQPKAVPDVDPDNPPEEFGDALEAEDFIIYGKASIEKLDDGGQNSSTPEILDMQALEDALDRFFTSEKAPGIISLGHDDIPVGQPLQEYTLDESSAIEVGGDTYEFDSGDTITTHVEDGDGDGRPELWLVADLANDTEIARKARLGVLMEELDGFSVTFGRKAVEPEEGGRRVTELDLFSVTLAPDEMVANKGAEFDLAGFKARMNQYVQRTHTDDAAGEAAEEVVETILEIV